MFFGVQSIKAQQVELNVKFNPSACIYEVYARPNFTQNNFILAGGSQISILFPNTVSNSSVVITNVNGGPWSDNSQVYAPAAMPDYDFHALSTNGSVVNFTAGQELLLLTFQLPGDSCCATGVRIFENGVDPQSNEVGMGGGDFNNYLANALSLTDFYGSNYDNNGTICDPCLINPVAVPTTNDTTQDFCLINTPTLADIQVNEVNIRWYDVSSAGVALPDTTPLVTGTTYYATQFELLNNCESATRLAVTVTINDAATPTTLDSTQDFCLVDVPTVGAIQVDNAGVTWYDAATGGAIVSNGTALVNGVTYYGSLTNAGTGCQSATRLAVTVTIGNAPTPTTTGATQDFCLIDNPTVADLQVNEAGVIWYNAATGGTIVPNGTALTNGSIYYGSLIDAVTGCQSATRLAVTVIVNNASTPTTTDTTQDFCLIDAPTVNDIQVDQAGIVWYTAITGGTVVSGNTLLTNGTTYYASQTIGGCQSATRLAVTVTIGNAITPTTTNATQAFCAYNNPTVADIQVNQAGVIWYSLMTGGTALATNTPLVTGNTYYGALVTGGCESATRLAVTVNLSNLCDVTLNLKAALQGALYGTSNGLMRDNLRTLNLIPLNQPYSSALNMRFTHVNGGGSEVTTAAVLNVSGGNAIVDWIFIEIRDALAPQTVIRTVSALLQRDGDIVSATGDALVVSNLPESFIVAVKHRNHFGAMSAEAVTVQNNTATLDFTTMALNDFYTLPGNASGVPVVAVSGLQALRAGNANYDRRIKYDGVNNDRQMQGSQVLSHIGNTSQVLNFAGAEGYFSGDINMDGKVLYDGVNNDRQIILNIVVTYPLNTGTLANYNDLVEQIP